jgi:tetratricopeptide (TPR) repeat protein
VLYNIATIHLESGDDEEAMTYYRETLRVERVALGPKHKAVLETMQHVGQVHQKRGELDIALEYFEEVLAIRRADPNPYYAAIAKTYNFIGNVYLQRGQTKLMVAAFAEAVRCFRLAGESDDELDISGFNFYGLAKSHPEAAQLA